MLKNYTNTFKQVLLYPGDVIDSFIHSKADNKYLHPFLFGVIGMVFVLLMNTIFVDFSIDTDMAVLEAESEQLQQIAGWIQIVTVRASTQFLPLAMLVLLIPLLSLPGLYFFRHQTEGFYSNLILNSYTVGASMIALLAAIPFWVFLDVPLTDPFMNSTLPGVLVASVGIWVYRLHFRVSDVMGWIRIISSFLTGYILFVLVKGFSAGIIGYMFFAVNRILEISGG
jgi:hypothetical protein